MIVMTGRLRDEIQQRRPFQNLEEEALLNVLRTADVLTQRIAAVLKPFQLSPSQYNVLRILRGAGEAGLACRDIAQRMITHDPDITRLLDRLEARGLISRAREAKDRRVVRGYLTAEGQRLLTELDGALDELNRRQLQPLGESRLRRLIEALELIRARPE
jgi:DNA-binding MarR family transcriptional regulator